MCAALAVMGVASASAQADWMTSGTDFLAGNGLFNDSTLDMNFASANVSAAVWDNNSGAFSPGAGITVAALGNNFGVDESLTAGRYIYFYQVVNSISTDVSISGLALPLTSFDIVESVGYLSTGVFNDGTDVGGGNLGLGLDSDTDDTFNAVPYADPTPFSIESGSPSGAVYNALTTLDDSNHPMIRFGVGVFNTGDATPVFYFTSNVAPVLSNLPAILDHDLDSTGMSIVPSPLPASLALLLTSVPGLGLVFWRRKKEQVAA